MTFLAALLASTAMLAGEGNIDQTVPPKKEFSRASIIASGLSYHINDKDYSDKKRTGIPFNNFNYGLGFEYRLTRHLHANVGFYENSKRRTSLYASVGAETSEDKFFGAGLEAGGVTGYHDGYKPQVMALPYARLGSRKGLFSVQVMLLPPLFVAANIRVNLNKK